MNARTIATVAAAGLAALLVGGCKSDEKAKELPHWDGTIWANAPACDNKPQVHMNLHSFTISCGDYKFSYNGYERNGCTLDNQSKEYVDNECKGIADDMFIHSGWNQINTNAYNEALKAIGAIDIVKRLPEASRLAEVLGPQKIDFLNVSAPACDNKSQINLGDYYFGGAFSITCGEYYFLHTVDGNMLSKEGNPEQVWFDDWHDGSVDRSYLDYSPLSESDNAAFSNALIQIGAEDVEAQWRYWLKKQ